MRGSTCDPPCARVPMRSAHGTRWTAKCFKLRHARTPARQATDRGADGLQRTPRCSPAAAPVLAVLTSAVAACGRGGNGSEVERVQPRSEVSRSRGPEVRARSVRPWQRAIQHVRLARASANVTRHSAACRVDRRPPRPPFGDARATVVCSGPPAGVIAFPPEPHGGLGSFVGTAMTTAGLVAGEGTAAAVVAVATVARVAAEAMP